MKSCIEQNRRNCWESQRTGHSSTYIGSNQAEFPEEAKSKVEDCLKPAFDDFRRVDLEEGFFEKVHHGAGLLIFELVFAGFGKGLGQQNQRVYAILVPFFGLTWPWVVV